MEALFAALESPLLSYALRLLGDRSQAEDVVQEAFMKLQTHFGEVASPRGWLHRTVHNLAMNHRRQNRRLVPLESPADPGDPESVTMTIDTTDPHPLPDEQIAHWENIGLVRLTLKTLDERSRQLIELKFVEDLSYREIAERTGLTVGHVGYLLHHAIKSIATELARTGVMP